MGGISTVGRGEGALCGRRWSAQHPSDHPAASVERFLPRFLFFFFFLIDQSRYVKILACKQGLGE